MDSQDDQSGIYVFGAIQTDKPKNFGAVQMGEVESPVYTIQYKNVAMVVSQTRGDVYPQRGNYLSHQRVLNRIFEEFTVIPFSFGNTFHTEQDILLLAESLYGQFNTLFSQLENKIEVGLKVIGKREWLDQETKRYPQLLELADKVRRESEEAAFYDRIRMGELAQKLFVSLEESLKREVHDPLAKLAASNTLNDVRGERVLLNAAYLIDRGIESEFDNHVNELYEKWKDQMEFRYSGPWPPFNFVNIRLKMERST